MVALDAGQRAELEKLRDLGTSDQEKKRIDFLLASDSNVNSVGNMRVAELLALYNTIGHLAVLDADGGRGASFAANQGQGAWAEALLMGYAGAYRFVTFGLSTPIAPTAPNYELVRRQHRYTLLNEGKRPDLLLVPAETIEANPSIQTWEHGPQSPADRSLLLANALAGVEIKSSLFDWGRRLCYQPTVGSKKPPVSIPLKEEEIPDLVRWQTTHRIPIMIVQVFVDSVHACSLDHFRGAIKDRRAHCYTEQKTTKTTCYLTLPDASRKLADIALATGQPQFEVADAGEVTRPGTWPQARLVEVNLAQLVDGATNLKARYAAKDQ